MDCFTSNSIHFVRETFEKPCGVQLADEPQPLQAFGGVRHSLLGGSYPINTL